MMARYHSGVHKYALFVVAWTVILLTAGALVTSEDAALAVPDWPLSYGTLNPPMVGGIAFEHSHRLIAAALGLFIMVLAFLLWKYDERPWMKYLGFAALGGVIFQGVLGGLTVLKLSALLAAGDACVHGGDYVRDPGEHRGVYQPVVHGEPAAVCG